MSDCHHRQTVFCASLECNQFCNKYVKWIWFTPISQYFRQLFINLPHGHDEYKIYLENIKLIWKSNCVGEKLEKSKTAREGKNKFKKLKLELLSVFFPVVTNHGPTCASKQRSKVLRGGIFEQPDSSQGSVDDHSEDKNENQWNLKRNWWEKLICSML